MIFIRNWLYKARKGFKTLPYRRVSVWYWYMFSIRMIATRMLYVLWAKWILDTMFSWILFTFFCPFIWASSQNIDYVSANCKISCGSSSILPYCLSFRLFQMYHKIYGNAAIKLSLVVLKWSILIYKNVVGKTLGLDGIWDNAQSCIQNLNYFLSLVL